MQEIKEKEKNLGNGDLNSHLCKVCYETPTAAILLPCRHFCCKLSEIIVFSFAYNLSCVSNVTFGLTSPQYVNLVRLLVQNAQYAAQVSLIEFLHSLHDSMSSGLNLKVLRYFPFFSSFFFWGGGLVIQH